MHGTEAIIPDSIDDACDVEAAFCACCSLLITTKKEGIKVSGLVANARRKIADLDESIPILPPSGNAVEFLYCHSP